MDFLKTQYEIQCKTFLHFASACSILQELNFWYYMCLTQYMKNNMGILLEYLNILYQCFTLMNVQDREK